MGSARERGMMNAPLSRFLMEFSGEVAAPEPFELHEMEPAVEAEPTITLTVGAFEQQLQDAREQAASDAQANTEVELKTLFEEERAQMARDFEAARETWATEEGQQISASLVTAVAELETNLSNALAQALRPLFSEACRARMLVELGAALASILGDPSHPPVRIAGPIDLLTAFGNTHPADIAIDYVVADQAELTIVTDTTRIESRLAACLSTFQISEE
jgi:hypothetical protein